MRPQWKTKGVTVVDMEAGMTSPLIILIMATTDTADNRHFTLWTTWGCHTHTHTHYDNRQNGCGVKPGLLSWLHVLFEDSMTSETKTKIMVRLIIIIIILKILDVTGEHQPGTWASNAVHVIVSPESAVARTEVNNHHSFRVTPHVTLSRDDLLPGNQTKADFRIWYLSVTVTNELWLFVLNSDRLLVIETFVTVLKNKWRRFRCSL